MVRYRPEAGERGYTFRLVNSAYSGNPTGTISDHSSTIDSSIYKERIDSLFRERQHRRNEDDEDEDDDDDDAIKSSQPTMEHLKLHFQKVMAEERKTSAISTPASTTSSKNNNTTTYITVNNQVNSSGKLQPSENKSGEIYWHPMECASNVKPRVVKRRSNPVSNSMRISWIIIYSKK